MHLCLKSLPWDRYPAYHPSVLSCKQQTFALSKVHEVNNTNIKRDINTAVLPLVATAHPRCSGPALKIWQDPCV